ncbi:MAG: glutathione S-transferase family protein [Rhodobacterales bacterium]|jgi:glutathione S-transferase|nr:glutathione S-transferase family protein [Planktomarina sp.]MDA9100537.1 glutathione S-transferase [Planktomarina sp.]|tara:strand:+ start:777 stop:1442 length:666 start_codon:yes stop_codon:yes gene_type:complete
MKLKFIYVDTPFWRAEVGRIALFMGDIKFDDVRIKREDFSTAKETGTLSDGTVLPFHQIPCLVVDDVSIAQTGAIARFCGKLSGLYPTHDDVNAAKIDDFIDFATDLTVMIDNTPNKTDEEKKRKARRDLATGPLKRKLSMLEKNISSDSEWLVTSNISIADVAIWRLLGWLSSGILDGMPTDLLSGFPKIRKLCLAVDKHPKIQKWISLTYPNNYTRGNY